MALRTIMIFPEFQNVEIIESIRKQYDPLSDLIRPHITLVFPFEGEISDSELRLILDNQLQDIQPFTIRLQGVSKHEDQFGNYLFLDVDKGENILQKIHEKLYANELKRYYTEGHYIPHMTIGKLRTNVELEDAYEKLKEMNQSFETVVDTISVEMIGKNEESIIIIEKELR